MGIIASLDIDAQKGFTPLCPNELPVAGGDTIVAALNAQAALATLRAGSKDAHPRERPWVVTEPGAMLQPLALANADLTWPAHCVPGTPGFELLDGLPAPSTTTSSSGRGRAGPASLWRLLSRPGGAAQHRAHRVSASPRRHYRAGRRSRHRLLRQDQRAATASRRFPGHRPPRRLPRHRPETIDQARTRMIEAGAELAQTLADIQRLLDA